MKMVDARSRGMEDHVKSRVGRGLYKVIDPNSSCRKEWRGRREGREKFDIICNHKDLSIHMIYIIILYTFKKALISLY